MNGSTAVLAYRTKLPHKSWLSVYYRFRFAKLCFWQMFRVEMAMAESICVFVAGIVAEMQWHSVFRGFTKWWNGWGNCKMQRPLNATGSMVKCERSIYYEQNALMKMTNKIKLCGLIGVRFYFYDAISEIFFLK